jgi:hypothetical protein
MPSAQQNQQQLIDYVPLPDNHVRKFMADVCGNL